VRVVLFTGKGGVGKTTVAAATAVRAAASGLRTMIMSTDPAHSLADSFEVEIGSEPTEVAANLWAQQVDAQDRLESNWREIQEYVIQLMNWAGTETIQAEELTVIPGLDEVVHTRTHVPAMVANPFAAMTTSPRGASRTLAPGFSEETCSDRFAVPGPT